MLVISDILHAQLPIVCLVAIDLLLRMIIFSDETVKLWPPHNLHNILFYNIPFFDDTRSPVTENK